MASLKRWAKLIIDQINENRETTENDEWRNEWIDLYKAMSVNGTSIPKGSASSYFEKAYRNTGKLVKDRPATIQASNFECKAIPKDAYITKITFRVEMMVKGKITVRCPRCRFELFGGKNTVKTNVKNKTGWEDGYYYDSPNKNITNSWQTFDYVMNETEFHRKGYLTSALYDNRFGVKLRFYQPSKQADSNRIYIRNVSVIVDYVVPNHKIIMDTQTSGDNPLFVDIGEEYTIAIQHKNDSKAKDTAREIKVGLPDGVEIIRHTGNYDTENSIWNVGNDDKLTLTLKNWNLGLKAINFSEAVIGNYNYYVYGQSNLEDIGSVESYVHNIHKGHKEYIDFKARVMSHDGTIQFDVQVDNRNQDIPVKWELTGDTDSDVTIDPNSTNNLIMFNVPVDVMRDISFRGYFVSPQEGEATVTIGDYTNTYTVLPPYNYIFTNNPRTDENTCNLIVNPTRHKHFVHRGKINTNIETPVINCSVVDTLLEIGECKLNAAIMDKVNYIGKVVLRKITHCNPKSKLSNKLIRESGKNHTFLGKENDINEDISLTTYVRPADSVTLQGYVELDEPVPINANHECFEGDPLNHRGWVLITDIEIEQTNPLWYKVDLTVNYITHDLSTKFEIVKGEKTENGKLPELFASIIEAGEDLSQVTDILEIDTDGSFMYDDDETEIDNNNIFKLWNNQKLSIKTRNPLSNVFEIIIDWMSFKIGEDNQNNLSRIFKLVDVETGQSIMEYEYTDFKFYEDSIFCDVLLRVMNEELGQDLKNDHIELMYERVDSDDDSEEEILYGSSLRLKVNQNKLSVIDEGFNGLEFKMDDVSLLNKNYLFLMEWINRNDEGSDEEIISYMNIELNETILNNAYSGFYDKLVISPFPIPKKQLVFTRESNEGTLYYYKDDDYPFKYRVEPYYQFLNGTNLVTREGVSLFNLNNSYSHFYIENGLVRLGFNRYNGELYLAKYDVVSKSWVTTHYFKMREDIKFSLPAYSLRSDRITIQAGDDTFFTIWRGHPFIGVSHPTDSIFFDNNFNYIYGDYIDGVEEPIPVMYHLLNTDNLLPPSIGGELLSTKDISVDDDYSIPDVDVRVSATGLVELEESVFKIDSSVSDGMVYYFVDGDEVGSSAISGSHDFNYSFENSGNHTLQAVYFVNDGGVGVSDVVNADVTQRDPPPDYQPPSDVPEGKFNVVCYSVPSTLNYRDNKEILFKLTKGGVPISSENAGVLVKVQKAWTTATPTANENGIITVHNTDEMDRLGTFIWECNIFIEGEDVPICKRSQKIKMNKGNPYFELDENNTYGVGKPIKILLKDGVDGMNGEKILYRINDGAKKTKTTSSGDGSVTFTFSKKGNYKVKVYYAANNMYNKASKTFNILIG